MELTRVTCISLTPAAPNFEDVYDVAAGATYEAVVGEWGFMQPANAVIERDAGTVLIHSENTMGDIEAAVGGKIFSYHGRP